MHSKGNLTNKNLQVISATGGFASTASLVDEIIQPTPRKIGLVEDEEEDDENVGDINQKKKFIQLFNMNEIIDPPYNSLIQAPLERVLRNMLMHEA